MAKVRVYQLAKDLEVQSALILELLDRMGQEVKSDLSTLDEETAGLVRIRITSAIAAEKERVAVEHELEQEQADVGEEQADVAVAEPAPVQAVVEPAAPADQPKLDPVVAVATLVEEDVGPVVADHLLRFFGFIDDLSNV